VTYSVVAFDSASGQFGVAVASCVSLDVVQRVPGEVSGRGAFVTQSYLLDGSQAVARRELEKGATAEATLAALIDPAFDPDFQLRQYAVIDADGGAASFTGEGALFHASHRTKRFGSLVYSIQGNILRGEATLDNMEAGFVADVCDLPERLVRALETASFDRGGDSRCTSFGHPAKSAVVRVPSLGLALENDVGDQRIDPVIRIRMELDAWHGEHPCTVAKGPANTEDDGCRVSSSSSFDAFLLLPILGLALLRLRRRAGRRHVP
jgi:uncharacterized Ntn-hydrolase superfamily protein